MFALNVIKSGLSGGGSKQEGNAPRTDLIRQKVINELKSMQKTWLNMPDCFEKRLLGLLFLCVLKKEAITSNELNEAGLSGKQNESVEDGFNKLKEKSDELNGQTSRSAQMLNQVLQFIRSENWASCVGELRKVLKAIRPLDFQELFRLIDEAHKAADMIKKKDVVFFLGGTGAGKSTTIHFLAGSKMVETMVELESGESIKHIAPREPSESLKNITCSPFAESETRYISPVTVNFRDIGGSEDGSAILCDAPGFGDTAGVEVDIANNLGIIKAIQGCKSIRLVILLSQLSIGDKGDGVKNLIRLLAGMIKDVNANLQSFQYLFTKYSSNENIHANLVNISNAIKRNSDLSSDQTLTALLQDILDKTKKGATCVDPIYGDPYSILQDILNSPAISNPDNVFQCSISDASYSVIREQCGLHKMSIITRLKQADYTLVEYKLRELKRLKEILQNQYVDNVYQECVQLIVNSIESKFQNTCSVFNRVFENSTLISEDEISQYKTCLKQLHEAEVLKEYLGTQLIESNALKQFLEAKMSEMLIKIKNFNGSSDKQVVRGYMNHLKHLGSYFEDSTVKYKEACRLINAHFNELFALDGKFDAARTSLKLSEIKSIYDFFNNDSSVAFSGDVNIGSLKQGYERLVTEYKNSLTAAVELGSRVLSKGEILSQSDLKKLEDTGNVLEIAVNCVEMQAHVSRNEVDKIYEQLLSQVTKHVNSVTRKIEENLKGNQKEVKSLIEQLDSLKAIPGGIGQRVTYDYNKTLQSISSYMDSLRNEVEKQLRLLDEDKGDKQKLALSFARLMDAERIEQVQDVRFSVATKGVLQDIHDHAKNYSRANCRANLSLTNYSNIETAWKNMRNLDALSCAEKYVDDLLLLKKNAETSFENSTERHMLAIIESCNAQKDFEFDLTECALNYIAECLKWEVNESIAKEAGDQLKRYVDAFVGATEREILNSFQKIQSAKDDRLVESAQLLRAKLNEIREYEKSQEKLPQLRNLIGQRLTRIAQENEELRKNLRSEIEQDISNHNTAELELKREMARAMSIVDDSFNEVYKSLRQELYTEVIAKHREAMDFIEKHEFHKLAVTLSEIEKNQNNEKDLSKIRQALEINLIDLVEDTKKMVVLLGKDLNRNEILRIIENYGKFEKAEKHVLNRQDGNINIVGSKTLEQVRIGVDNIRQSVSRKIVEYLDHIEALIGVQDFYEAEEKIEQIRQVLQLAKMSEECVGKFDGIVSSVDKAYDETMRRYSELAISDYVNYPPKHVLEKLSNGAKYKTKYSQGLNRLVDAIKAKMNEALSEAKESSEKRRERIREIEFAIKTLPEDLKNIFERQLESVKDEIEKDTRQDEAILGQKLQSNDLQAVVSFLEECKKENKAALVKKIQESVNDRFQSLKAEFINSLKYDDIKGMRNQIPTLAKYQSHFGAHIHEIAVGYELIQRLLIDKLFTICDYLGNIGSTDKSIESSLIQKNIDMFFSLTEVISSELSHFNTELFNDVEARILKLENEIEILLAKISKLYRTALEEVLVEDLKGCLKLMSSWDVLIKKVVQTKPSFKGRLMFQNVKEIGSYSEMFKQVVEKLVGLKAEILAYEQIQGSENALNLYYEAFSRKVALLSQIRTLEDIVSKESFDCKGFESEAVNHIKIKTDEMATKAKTIVKNDTMRNKDYDEIHSIIQNLTLFDKYCKLAIFGLKKKLNEISYEIEARIRALSAIVENENAKNEDIGESLIKLKLIGDNILSFKDAVNKEIDSMLLIIKNQDRSGLRISFIATYLQRDARGIGQIILQEHNTFKGEAISFFNNETRRKDIMYVLENLGDCAYDNQFCEERKDTSCKTPISKTSLDGVEKHLEAGCNKNKGRSCYCNVKQLFDFYNIFEEKYKALLKDYLFNRIERNEDKNGIVSELINGAKAEARVKFNHNESAIDWSLAIKEKIANILAYVFAVWTIKHAEYYLEIKNNEKKETYLLQPHPAQVVAIFRILGMGYRQVEKSGPFKSVRDYFTNNKNVDWRDVNGLINNLAQVLTGQGKSVILAVTSIVLALFDIDVSCACYSEYLSRRDLEAFTDLFNAFGVSDRIQYGTFNKICENIINENGDIRQRIIELIASNTNKGTKKTSKRPKVLLIDEVDIFFTKLFYGNVYTPVVRLKDPLIVKLVDSIWQRRDQALSFSSIESTIEYKNCCERFKGWEFLIREAVKSMLFDVKDYKHDYIVSNNKVAYYEHDSISYNISYGYKTLFAYYHENEANKITRESLEENVCIEIHCGSFSYAEIPHQFLNIMGVTGTLETLNPNEAEIVKNEYKINRFSIIPSVYSENKLVFAKYSDVFIENRDSFFITLFEKIEEKLKEKDNKRAVLVFFETPLKLNAFYNSVNFTPFKDRALKITEDLTRDEKEKNIKRSTTAGQITLATSSFGRGTDFICRDQNVLSNGGLHVIQTFLSENYSDEVQIKGRTARQGQSGSYSMVLLDEDLEKFLGPSYQSDIQEMRNGNKVYDGLHEAARRAYERKFSDLAKFVERAKKEHTLTMDFLKNLEENNLDKIRAYLGERNIGASSETVLSRTVCLMDATGSMSSLLIKAKTTVASMFERVTKILSEHGISSDCFQMQFAVFRDYDSGASRILQYSSWESQPNNLRQFMEIQKAEGGGDYEEAIEVALWHVNEEHKNAPVSQIILIGDAPAKTKQSIEYDRNQHYGSNYWKKSKYSEMTDYETEAKKLLENEIKVHAFYLDHGAKSNFERIAEITKGSAHRLNIHADNSDDVLTGIVSKQILESIGKAKGNSKDLLDSYKRQYGAIKGYFE